MPTSDPKAVEAHAEIRTVRSLEDGTYNLTLNFPEDCLPQIQALMGWLRDEVKVIILREAQTDGR